jgi:Spy/CpxP family protein refolding chaperone
MMKYVKYAVVVALLTALTMFSVQGHAQMGGGMGMSGGMMGRGQMMDPEKVCQKHCGSLMAILHCWGSHFFRLQDELGLSENQVDDIQSVVASHVKYGIQKKAERRILLIDIQELLVKEKIDYEQVKKKLKVLEAVETDLALDGIRTLEKSLAVLTPEQQKKVRAQFKQCMFMGIMEKGMMQGMMGPGAMQEKAGPAMHEGHE